MWRTLAKGMAATAGFAVVHSLLASRQAKDLAARQWGERNRNGLYRVFYLGQSMATFGLLVAYLRSLPSQELYRVKGVTAWGFRAAQLAALVTAVDATRQVGLSRMAGLDSFIHWLKGGPVPPEPEAQGPALDDYGQQQAAGPFAWSRHPLNAFPLVVLWLTPVMTTARLAFNLAATAYLIVGSRHEESRLREAYGEAYVKYQNSGVPFYFPSFDRSPTKPLLTERSVEASQGALSDDSDQPQVIPHDPVLTTLP